jgi:uncharacterized membrane protein
MKSFWGPFLFGIGIIGMLDGIILHQLLQWHSIYMHTNREGQIFSDGLFHLFITVIIFIAGFLLWQDHSAGRKGSLFTFWGSFLIGAGGFNLVEGIVNHHLLRIHHVRPYSPYSVMYDLSFDGIAILMLGIGWFLYKKGKRPAQSS